MTWVPLDRALENAVWYSALFNLAANRTHQPRPSAEDRARARKEALLLSYACLFWLDRRERGEASALPPELTDLDDDLFRQYFELDSRGPERASDPMPVSKRLTVRRNGVKDTPERTQHVLHEFLERTVERSALVLFAGTLLPVSGDLNSGLEGGEPTFDRGTVLEELRIAARDEKWPDPVRLVRAVANQGKIDSRTHYNLACFFAQLSERSTSDVRKASALERGREHFMNAFNGPERVGLAEWARKDRSIEPVLSGWKEGGELLDEIAGADLGVDAPAHKRTLDALDAIGGHAPALREADIRSEAALRERTATDDARKKLARELNVSEALVARWTGLAGLLGIDGIGMQEANLLDAAGVSSLATLRSQDPEELRNRLAETIVARQLDRRAPSARTLRDWIAQAAIRAS